MLIISLPSCVYSIVRNISSRGLSSGLAPAEKNMKEEIGCGGIFYFVPTICTAPAIGLRSHDPVHMDACFRPTSEPATVSPFSGTFGATPFRRMFVLFPAYFVMQYLKTTLTGMTGTALDYAMLVVSGVAGVQRMTREHLAIALALQVMIACPVAVSCSLCQSCPLPVSEFLSSCRLPFSLLFSYWMNIWLATRARFNPLARGCTFPLKIVGHA